MLFETEEHEAAPQNDQAFVSLTETQTHWLLSIAGTCVALGNNEVSTYIFSVYLY
jgi:hypothetical protein